MKIGIDRRHGFTRSGQTLCEELRTESMTVIR